MDAPGPTECRLAGHCRILLIAVVLLMMSELFALPEYRPLSRIIGLHAVSLPFTSNSSKTVDLDSSTLQSQPRSDGSPPADHIDPLLQNQAPDASLLLEALQRTRRIASGGVLEKLGDKERKEWQRRNPCASRFESSSIYEDRKHVKQLKANPEWNKVLKEYSELHRACTNKVEDITSYHHLRKDIPGCKFLIADPAEGAGMGNKLLILASAFVYAISTQRVLLVASRSFLPDNTCEPFPGSSWRLRSDFPLPRGDDHAGWSGSGLSVWKDDDEFFREIDEQAKLLGRNASSELAARRSQFVHASYNDDRNATFPWRSEDYAVIGSPESKHGYQPLQRFYCTAEQEYYAQIPFVLWGGYINTIPRLYTTPTFMPALESLFPDHTILTRVVRSIALPSDPVWTRVKHLNHAYLLSAAERRVGIQVRYRDGVVMKDRMEGLINSRISECLWKENILPKFDRVNLPASTFSEQSLGAIKRSPIITVFIASLFRGLFDHLSKIYTENPVTMTGEDVSLVQLTSREMQTLHSGNEDVQAFTEIILLSFSDQLLITPVSTFGGLAQAYGAITPYFIEFLEDPPNGTKLEPCLRGRTVDVAQHISNTLWHCPFQDPPFGNLSLRARISAMFRTSSSLAFGAEFISSRTSTAFGTHDLFPLPVRVSACTSTLDFHTPSTFEFDRYVREYADPPEPLWFTRASACEWISETALSVP